MKVQLATRLDAGLRQRLRIYAAVTGGQSRTWSSVALDGYLPPASEMVQGGSQSCEDLLAEQPEAVA